MEYSLSKSRFCNGLQCPKMLWLQEHLPEAFDPASKNQSVLENGLAVGDLAMGLFGEFTEVPYGKPGDMVVATDALMAENVPVIAEASFSADGCFCSVDILRRLGDKEVALYEVKSSSSLKEIHLYDAAYQYHVLEELGYQVASCNVVHLDKDYVRQGPLDIQKLFKIVDVTEQAKNLQDEVKDKISFLRNYMKQEKEPADDIGMYCFKPYDCGFFGHCTKHLPKPNVFDVGGIHKNVALDCYYKGITSFKDLNTCDALSAGMYTQVEHELYHYPPHVDVTELRNFLKKLTYPIYFFDFETTMPAVPPYDGMSPYNHLPFQYSLHYIEYEGGPIHHREFLGYPDRDPRRALAEQMCADIPKDVCITAYNMGFEKGKISMLADMFPDLSEHLKNIRDHIVDLMIPFQKKWYYCRDMQGSYSIKYVLPALFPNDPELDYHNLDGVHNGGEAMSIFPMMATMTPEEQEVARRQLLDYCALDTYAMIKLLDKLKELCK